MNTFIPSDAINEASDSPYRDALIHAFNNGTKEVCIKINYNRTAKHLNLNVTSVSEKEAAILKENLSPDGQNEKNEILFFMTKERFESLPLQKQKFFDDIHKAHKNKSTLSIIKQYKKS